MSKILFSLLYIALGTSLLQACGHEGPSLPPSAPQPNAQLTQLTQQLEGMQSRLSALEKKEAKPATAAPASKAKSPAMAAPAETAAKSTDPAPKTASADKAKSPSAPTPKPQTVDKSAEGRQILDKVMASIAGVAGFDTLVNKYEIGLQNGEESDAQIRMIGKNPHRIKIEITRHATKKGLKVAYKGGDSKVDIRPNGVLSLINTSKKMNDPLLLSKNGHEPDDMDFYSLAERFANPAYKAELAGKVTLNGQTIHILKVTSPANTLNPVITHEYIGFDPQTYSLRLWEAYSDKYQGGQKAFIRSVVESFKVLTDVPEQLLKV